MPQLSLEMPHQLTQEEAARRLKDRFETVTQMYRAQLSELSHQWDGHTFSFDFHTMGMKIAGTVAVEQAKVKLAASLPLAAMLFKGMIEDRIRQEMGQVLA
jgi:hypothetical protein